MRRIFMDLCVSDSEDNSSHLLSAERPLSAHIGESVDEHGLDLLHVLHSYCSVNQQVGYVVIDTKTHDLLDVVGIPFKVFSKDSGEIVFLLVLKVVFFNFFEQVIRIHAYTFSVKSIQLVSGLGQLRLTGSNACFSVAHLGL